MLPTQWEERLRARGYRSTPQRQLVLEAVDELGHATPEEILVAVRRTAAGVNITTVYRTLEVLEEIGLVTHVHLHHGSPTYHTVGSGSEHVHLVCRRCGSVLEESVSFVAPMVAAAEQRHGFEVDVGHLAVFGLCAACRSESREDEQ